MRGIDTYARRKRRGACGAVINLFIERDSGDTHLDAKTETETETGPTSPQSKRAGPAHIFV